MGKIHIKFDNTLKQSDIIVPLTNSSIDESGKNYKDNQPEIQQSLVYGIQAPLIMVNNIVVDFNEVIEFSLKSAGVLPTLSMIIKDRFGLINTFDNPRSDNEVRIQILPRFDQAYKKINLTFYISNIRINGNTINITGLYKLSKLTSSQFKSFGETNIYNLCEYIAKETGLGMATNIEAPDDTRYIYCDNKSYLELLSKEIMYSCSYAGSIDGENKKLRINDFWIDFWNNLNIVDIYERYNSVDKEEDMQIWISNQMLDVKEGDIITPIKTTAIINNHPSTRNTELYAEKIITHNKTGQQLNAGTDKVYSVYSIDNQEYTDQLVQDGDVKKDIFIRHEYLGEVYGEYDYLMAERLRTSFIQKINSESIEVSLNSPLLGLMRGSKVDVIKYYNDSVLDMKKSNMDERGGTNITLNTQIPLDVDDSDNPFKIDKTISGQYLITACNIRFYNNKWEYILTLNRPASDKPKILKENE